MSLGVGRTKLHNALEAVQAHWSEVLPKWNDPVRQDFEADYVAPLAPHVQAAIRALDRLGQVIAQMRQECS